MKKPRRMGRGFKGNNWTGKQIVPQVSDAFKPESIFARVAIHRLRALTHNGQ